MRKSLFISVYLMLATAITVTAAQQVVATQDFVTWGGVLLTTAPLLLVLGWVMTFRNIARTSARMPAIIVMGLIVVSRGLVVLAVDPTAAHTCHAVDA